MGVHSVRAHVRPTYWRAAGGRFTRVALGAAVLLCALAGSPIPASARGSALLAGAGEPFAGGLAAPMPGASAAASPLAAFTSGHPYRHGVVPALPWTRAHRAQLKAYAEGIGPLYYRGGIDGVGVTIGAPRVYVVLWGSQWGTEGTNGAGFKTFSGDPHGMAPDIQAFFTGLGSEAAGEKWSSVIAHYCEGVSVDATQCPTGVPHVGLPSGGALAGVWEDSSKAAPAEASAHEIAEEAARGRALPQ
jgi:hypothetical protein